VTVSWFNNVMRNRLMMTTVAAILFAAACVPESADDESGNGYPTAGSETTDNEDGDAPVDDEPDDTLWIWLFGNDDTQPQDFVGVMAPERPARQVGVELYTLDGSAQSGMTIIVDTEMGELLPLDNFPHFGGTGFTGGAGICENGNLLLFGRMAGSFDTIGGTRYVPIVDNPDFGDGLTGSTFITLAPAGTGNVVIRPEMRFDWSPDPAAGVGCGAVSFGPDQLPFAAEFFDTILTY
jgi:hypothetical protein